MITRWILPPPALTRFVTDYNGDLHIEAATGGEREVIKYLRLQLDAWERQILAAEPLPLPVSREAMQGHAGRGGPGSENQYPQGAFHGGSGPIPTRFGPTPPYGPPGAAKGPNVQHAGTTTFENPNAPPPPNFAYGVVTPNSQPVQGGKPDMMKYGWANHGAVATPDPSAPGVAAMTQINPIPQVCSACQRLAVACDAQPNRCPQAEVRAEAKRIADVEKALAAGTNGTPAIVSEPVAPLPPVV